MNLLARREHSETELERKLRQRGFATDAIQPVLEQLAQEGLLSNQRFIENYIHFRTNKGYGPLRIRNELLERGISEDSIEHLLQISDNAWFIHARQVWQKKFKNQVPQDIKTRLQHMRFLQHRGFTLEQINHIFKNSDD